MGHLLFSTAEVATPLTAKVLAVEQAQDVWLFSLAESRNPADNTTFKDRLEDDGEQDFTNDFLGASQEDCRTWALSQWPRFNSLDPGLFVMVDERSANDSTISLQFYNTGEPELEFSGYGVLPGVLDAWYEFRIDYRRVFDAVAALEFGAFDVVYPTYFGRKGELTDENGVFDVERAERMSVGKDHGPGEGDDEEETDKSEL